MVGRAVFGLEAIGVSDFANFGTHNSEISQSFSVFICRVRSLSRYHLPAIQGKLDSISILQEMAGVQKYLT